MEKINPSEEYIETYSNDENNLLISDTIKPFNFINKINNEYILTKAVDLWKYYKITTLKKNRIKQIEFYNKISLFYDIPIKRDGVKCYKGLIITQLHLCK